MRAPAVRHAPPKAGAASRKAAPAKKPAARKAQADASRRKPIAAPKRPAAVPARPPARKKPITKAPLSKTAVSKPAPAPKPKPKAAPVAAKASTPPAAKAAPAATKKAAPAAKPTPAPAPVAATVAKVASPVPTRPPAAPLANPVPPGVVPRKPGRGTPKYFVAPVQAPLPAPTSRFADRFAPPRPPTRQMNKPEDNVPRQAHKADPKLANAWKSKGGRDLVDEEVLAMPEAEYMNEKQLEFFRAKLQALKDDLLSNAGETTEHLREDTSIVPDPADRATIEEEHALELRTRDRERKLLKKISQSLGRLDTGEYGFCDETGEPIGLGRLIARPTATLSLEAQQRRELKQKMFGD